MNETSVDWSLQKFGIGQPVPRSEDPKLVRGEGRYTDDVNLPGQAYAAIVRSRHAHGVIRNIDLAPARAMPGVIAAYTGADLAGYGPLKCNVGFKNRDGSDMRTPTLPALPRASEAAKPGAPQLYDDAPGNVALDYHYGDADKVAAAFASAAHVTKLDLINSRVVVNAMEPRAAVAAFDAGSGRFTVHTGCQGAFGMRGSLADILGVPVDKVHVVIGNVGGSFGMKGAPYP